MTEVLWEPRRQRSASRIAANREQSARKMDVQMPNAASAMGEQSRGLFPLVTRGSCGCFKFSEMHNQHVQSLRFTVMQDYDGSTSFSVYAHLYR